MAAFASESGDLSASIRELPLTLETANRTFTSLNAAFPPTRAFALEIIPGVRETPATIDAALPWIDQARPLVGENELGGLAQELAPATEDLARLTDEALDLLPQTDLAAKCTRDVILPTGDVVIRDEFTSGVENYKEFFYTLVGLVRRGPELRRQRHVRAVPDRRRRGDAVARLGVRGHGELFGNAVALPLGNRPAYPGRKPPYRPTVPCYTQRRPDLNGPAAARSLPTGQATLAAKKALPELRRKLRPFGSKDGVRK